MSERVGARRWRGKAHASEANGPHPVPWQLTASGSALLALQHSVGNHAVAQWVGGHIDLVRSIQIQRCGETPCDCTPEEGRSKASVQASEQDASPRIVAGAAIQRNAVSDCTTALTPAVVDAADTAQAQLNAANARLKPSTAVQEALFIAFHDPSDEARKLAAQNIASMAASFPNVGISCTPANKCPSGDPEGFARRGFGDIHICTENWEKESARSRARTLIHEAAHRFLLSDDHGGLGDLRGGDVDLSPADRKDNADSWAWLVSNLAELSDAQLLELGGAYREKTFDIDVVPRSGAVRLGAQFAASVNNRASTSELINQQVLAGGARARWKLTLPSGNRLGYRIAGQRVEPGNEPFVDALEVVKFSSAATQRIFDEGGAAILQCVVDVAGSGATFRTAQIRVEAPPPKPLHVTVPGHVLFDFASDTIAPAARKALLDSLGDAPLRADPSKPVQVRGHTDSKGPAAFNLTLSRRRAEAVKAILEEQFPNLAGHVEAEGLGSSEPVAPNDIDGKDNPEGRRKNRRVQIEFEAFVTER